MPATGAGLFVGRRVPWRAHSFGGQVAKRVADVRRRLQPSLGQPLSKASLAHSVHDVDEAVHVRRAVSPPSDLFAQLHRRPDSLYGVDERFGVVVVGLEQIELEGRLTDEDARPFRLAL